MIEDLSILDRFIYMLQTRPYVFIPLFLFFVIAKKEMGWRKMLIWTVLAWGTAFASEVSSIRNGFPYGWYYYVRGPESANEIWILGVPFWDSISYVFLSYFAFSAARVILNEPIFSNEGAKRFAFKTWIVGSVMMMLSDVVIDPVALRGPRWMLGRVYGYPEHGAYFGVTLDNFAGWLIVGLTIMGSFLLLVKFRKTGDAPVTPLPRASAIMYCVIIIFNTGVALYLQEYLLFLCDLVIVVPFTYLIFKRVFKGQRDSFFRLRPVRIR